jgi:hypothetical protein
MAQAQEHSKGEERSAEGRSAAVATSVELLRLARAGDRDAVNELFARHFPVLRRWAHGRLPRNVRRQLPGLCSLFCLPTAGIGLVRPGRSKKDCRTSPERTWSWLYEYENQHRDVLQSGGTRMPDETWKEALEHCLDNVDKACQSEGVKFVTDVLNELRIGAQDKFEQYHQNWPKKKGMVLQSASFIGKLAAVYAKVKNNAAKEVDSNTAWKAVEEVKKICRAHAETPEAVWDWCPERAKTGRGSE